MLPIRPDNAYNVYMANKSTSSAPLFGNASPQEVSAIQKEIDAFTSRTVQTQAEARKMLVRLGIAPSDDKPPRKD
jgi:hypothetical protein